MKKRSKIWWCSLAGVALALCAPRPASAAPDKPARLSPGSAAPAFRLRSLDGAMVRLDELAYPGKEKSYAKKRPVLLDFFRTDCEPCKRAMPELIGLHNTYHPRGVEVLLVALLEESDGRAKLERYLAEQKLPFKVVIDDAEHFAKKYLGDPVTLPATFLVDESGVVRKVKYGAAGSYEEQFGDAMREILSKWSKGAK